MSFTKELIAKTEYLFPDKERLKDYLADKVETVISGGFPGGEIGLRTRRMGLPTLEAGEFKDIETAAREELKRLLEKGLVALNKIDREGENAVLEKDEEVGLEAIIQIYGRPAILIQNNHFFPPPEGWEILEEKRNSIEKNCKSVGRIEVPGHPRLSWVGTGFLVAEDTIMTNKHVAREFCCRGNHREWIFESGINPCIDYVEELGCTEKAEFSIKKVIGIHKYFDLALLKVSKRSRGKTLPEPLTISSEAPREIEGHIVYVLGYPAWDGRRNDPEIMQQIFSNIYNVKRLQPGKITDFWRIGSLFFHDCSTLGGNSGSCVIDLETGKVVGLHFGGVYLRGNRAVALWTLEKDSLLTEAGVHFG